MNDVARGQVTRSAAEIYEEFFVPALFGEWPPRLADAARIAPGDSILDVACGTGIFAREAATRIDGEGTVVGIDVNDGMLDLARRKAPEVDWRHGPAEALPFADESFDAVGCQFALMFFDDRPGALREMWRVLKPGGRLVVAVWDAAENCPGYAAMIALVDRLFGADVADALRAPFVLGDAGALPPLFDAGGIPDVNIDTVQGTARFDSIADWVHTDVKGWTLADLIDDKQYAALLGTAESELFPFVGAGGRVAFPAPAHIVTRVKT